MSKRAFQFRFYPTDEQRELLAKTFGCVRFVYNSILHWRIQEFREHGQSIGYTEANAKLTAMKHCGEYPWLSEVSSVPLQQCLRHQQQAYRNFFGGRTRYPQFRSKHRRQSAEFTRSAFRWDDGELILAKCDEPLTIRWSRLLSGEPSKVTVSMDSSGRYFVSLLCEFEPKSLPVIPKMIGVDVGLKHLAITSDGEKIKNPRHTARFADKLARAQRQLSKKRSGSKNRERAKRKVSRINARIADARKDYLHKLSRRLVDENQVVCVETLVVKNMIRNRALSKAISDAGWGEFVRQLQYKGEWAGRQIVRIDRFYPSSKRCHGCGHVLEQLPLDVRSWTCPACGLTHDRDINAAKNIRAAGLAVLACGGDVRPTA